MTLLHRDVCTSRSADRSSSDARLHLARKGLRSPDKNRRGGCTSPRAHKAVIPGTSLLNHASWGPWGRASGEGVGGPVRLPAAPGSPGCPMAGHALAAAEWRGLFHVKGKAPFPVTGRAPARPGAASHLGGSSPTARPSSPRSTMACSAMRAKVINNSRPSCVSP